MWHTKRQVSDISKEYFSWVYVWNWLYKPPCSVNTYCYMFHVLIITCIYVWLYYFTMNEINLKNEYIGDINILNIKHYYEYKTEFDMLFKHNTIIRLTQFSCALCSIFAIWILNEDSCSQISFFKDSFCNLNNTKILHILL